MPFLDLHEFVQGQFAAFAGHDEYETQLTIWAHMQRSAKAAYDRERYESNRRHLLAQHRAWRIANPGYGRTRRARKPDGECRQGGCKAKRVDGRALCQLHLDRDRERKRLKAA